jgi:hypothetical protein
LLVQSITRTEDTLLRTILPSYMEYIHTYPHTLLTRYLGLFHLRVAGRKLRLVAMSNVFAFCLPAEAYDLKGSFVNRTVLQPGEKPTPGKIMKDNDLKREMRLDVIAQNMLIAQLQSDTDWLASHDIMDYSLLLGVNPVAGSSSCTKRDTYSDLLSRFSTSAESLASPRISTVGSSDALDRRTSDSSPRSSSSHAAGASKPIPIPPRSISMDPDAGRRSSLRSKLRFPLRQKKVSVWTPKHNHLSNLIFDWMFVCVCGAVVRVHHQASVGRFRHVDYPAGRIRRQRVHAARGRPPWREQRERPGGGVLHRHHRHAAAV